MPNTCFRSLLMLLAPLWIQSTSGAPAGVRERADEILEATGVRGGLIVHVGCGDGGLTAALGAKEGYLVHGLDRDAGNVEAARAHAGSQGLYGKVAIEKWTAGHLPYIDNLVNLLVAEDAAGLLADEMTRVLRPGGVAYLKKAGEWTRTTKPWPDHIDEWTHFLHDPSGNAVARDRVAGPPRRMQWLASPAWSRNHHKLASISSVVSAGGRIFAMVDEATSGSTLVPGRWSLVARDAFNGVLLWKHPIPSWAWEQHGFRAGPVQLPRLLVAAGDRVYAPLGLGEAVSAIDAATGEVATRYESTEGAEEIIIQDGVLLVVKGAPLAEHAAVHPLRRKSISFPNTKSILAIRAKTGDELWTWSETAGSPLMPLTLAAEGQRVLFQAGEAIVCLDLEEGARLWRAPSEPPGAAPPGETPAEGKKKRQRPKAKRPTAQGRGLGWSTATLVVHGGFVLWAHAGRLRALSAENGSPLWECPCKAGFKSPVDVFVAGGWVWVGPDYNLGRDLRSGRIGRRRLDLGGLRTAGHHHRCYRQKATDRYIIGGYRGMEFLDLVGENHSRNNWVRGTCQYGILPCNGLVYAPPHACGCYMEAKLYGFWALAPEGRYDPQGTEGLRFERGPAYADRSSRPADPSVHPPEDWPTYRHDPLRSGSTPSPVPEALKRAWRARIGGRISAPVVAADTVLISAVDAHRVVALSVGDGSVRWTFTAGGRVDSPPTIHGDLVLFGSADGSVYCLQLADGQLVWRLRPSPWDLRTVAFDRIESLWPVHGSVLILDGVAYVTAGRSSYLDGGIYLYGLEPATGKVLHATRIYSPHPWAEEGRYGPEELTRQITQNATDPKTFLAPDLSDAFSMRGGTTTDILTSDGASIYLRTMRFNRECAREARPGRHLFSTSSLLDGNENHRSHWVTGTGDFSRIAVAYSWIADRPGAYKSHVAVPYGLMLAFGDATVWGVRRMNGYTLYADTQEPLKDDDKHVADVRPAPEKLEPAWTWSMRLEMRPRAMVRAGEVLILGGAPDLTREEQDPEAFAAYEGQGEGLLRVISARDGARKGAMTLEAPPVWDGLAVARRRVYISRADGVVECLSGT